MAGNWLRLVWHGCSAKGASGAPVSVISWIAAALTVAAGLGCARPSEPPSSGPVSAAAAPEAAATAAVPARATLNVGIANHDPSSWDLQVAERQGLFAREGLTVETITGSMPALVQQLVSGSTQIAMPSADAGILAVDKGASLVYVAQAHRSDVFTFMADPSVRSFADLRGKSIATNSLKGGSASTLRELLLRHGVEPDAYSFVALGGTPERLAALKNGIVAATGVSQPRDLILTEEGFPILGSTSELEPNWAGTSTAVERRWATENEATLARFLRAQAAATNWLRDPANAEAAAAILADTMKVEARYTRALVEQYQGPAQWFLPDARLQPATFEPVIRDLVAIGDLAAAQPTSVYLDPGYLERALAR